MSRRRLPRSFYARPAETVARALLGKYLLRRVGNRERAGKIVETEAYIGPEDRASHAFGGKVTPRNRAEYFVGGRVYIYLVYGMYWQLNITTGVEGFPACVLLRALEVEGKSASVARGPGKLCRYLRLDRSFYGEDVTRSKRFWVEDRGMRVRQREIGTSARIGIDYSGPRWSRRKLRFFLRGSPAVSGR